MKEIIALVKPFVAEEVLRALEQQEYHSCCITEVKGFSRQKQHLRKYADSEYSLAFLPKVEFRLWVDDDQVDRIVRCIVDTARTGRIGDGKIFVLPAMTGDEALEGK